MKNKKWRDVMKPNFPKLIELVENLKELLKQKVPIIYDHF